MNIYDSRLGQGLPLALPHQGVPVDPVDDTNRAITL